MANANAGPKEEVDKVSDATAPSGLSEKKDEGAKGSPEKPAKTKRTVKYNGKEWPVHRSTKDTRTGAIWDYFRFKRSVHVKGGKKKIIEIGTRKRRPGTGTTGVKTEVEIEE